MGMSEVCDIRGACCVESSGVKDRLVGLARDETLKVLAPKPFKRELLEAIAGEDCEALDVKEEDDSIQVTVKKKEATQSQEQERKMENCMVCGGSLQYLAESVEATCIYCGKSERGYIICPKGHYVCQLCHGKGAFDAIRDLALSTGERDPLAIAEVMMSHPSVPMLGCENAWIASAALIAALKNQGSLKITEKQIVEAMERTKDQALTGYCGLTGVCGVAVGVGAVFSVILDAGCPKDTETEVTMRAVARTVDAIANDTGPCCCKSYVRTAMVLGCNLAKVHLKARLIPHLEKVSCLYVRRHPHGCRASRCQYLPKRPEIPRLGRA